MDATSPPAQPVPPIKIIIPTGYGAPDVARMTSPILVQNVNLAEKPTVSAKIAENKLINVKLISTAELSAISPQLPQPSSATTAGVEKITESSSTPEHMVSSKNTLLTKERDTESPAKGSREIRQLQESINSSMMLNELSFVEGRRQRTRRKSLVALEAEESENIRRSRSRSRSQRRSRSRSSVKSRGSTNSSFRARDTSDDKLTPKRANMRSANAEFVQKQQKFLKKVKAQNDSDQSGNDSVGEDMEDWERDEIEPAPKPGSDFFCWRCNKHNKLVGCSKCTRSFHTKCMKQSQAPNGPTDPKWKCPECIEIEIAEKINKGKPRFEKDFLSTLLSFTMKRLQAVKGAEQLELIDEEILEYHEKYVANKITLNTLSVNVEAKKYRSPEAFHGDVKWLLFNCTIRGDKHKSHQIAKNILKVCRQELLEIDTCFECYYKANTDENWFIDVCSRPHILLWAKLKGFPFWPAKAMSYNPQSNLVDVRFFGAHDRSWVPMKDCFLYSDEDPNGNSRIKRVDLVECIKEVNQHIEKLKDIFGEFKTAPLRTPYDVNHKEEQLLEMLPKMTKTQRNLETPMVIEELVSGKKPKLTVKIIRTADNHLSTAPLTDEPMKKMTGSSNVLNTKAEEDVPIKLRITTSEGASKNCSIVTEENKKLEMTMKRKAESWTIMEKNDKKQKGKSKSIDQLEEQRKLELTESLQLRPKNAPQTSNVDADEQQMKRPDAIIQNGKLNASLIQKPRGRGRPPKSPLELNCSFAAPKEPSNAINRKRRQTITGDLKEQQGGSSDIPEKRVLRNRNKSTNMPDSAASSKTETVATANTSSTTKKNNSPPPLVPFEAVSIKSETISDDESPIIQVDLTSPVRINVRDINSLKQTKKSSNTLLNRSKSNAATHERATQRPITNGMISIPTQNGPIEPRRISTSDVSLSGVITTGMATVISDIITQTPPQLNTRPSGILRSDGGSVFPSDAGSVSKFLADNAHKMTDFFRTVIEDTLDEMGGTGNLEAKVRKLELENEQLKLKHEQELKQLQLNSDRLLNEYRNSTKKRETQLISEVRKQCDNERIRAVEDTKRKQWCVQCYREAKSYCCVHAWYCSATCQQKDWSRHMPACDQPRINQHEPQSQQQQQQQQPSAQQQQQNNVQRRKTAQISAHHNPQNKHQQQQQIKPQISSQSAYLQRQQAATTATTISPHHFQQQPHRTTTQQMISGVQGMVITSSLPVKQPQLQSQQASSSSSTASILAQNKQIATTQQPQCVLLPVQNPMQRLLGQNSIQNLVLRPAGVTATGPAAAKLPAGNFYTLNKGDKNAVTIVKMTKPKPPASTIPISSEKSK